MMNALMRLYRHLPGPMRSSAATLRGAYLQWWRFGPESERLMDEARAREQWSAAEWESWRQERLARVLHRAATKVEFYRRHWSARRRRGDRASWEQLENWPRLSKESLRRDPRAFVADDVDVRRLFHQCTSGTTGTPLDLWRSRATQTALYAIATVRTRGWHGVAPGDPWARMGGQVVVPIEQRSPPFWVWNGAARQLYLSTYHLAPDLVPHYLDALARHRVASMSAYPSSAYVLAQEALRLGRRDVALKVVFTNAEPLSEEQREVISRAFQCPVRETYGMGELVAAASECPAGRLHQWPELGLIEVWDGEHRVDDGGLGEFVCTGWLNEDMPLVRYEVGDCGRLETNAEPCECGRSLLTIASVNGRTNDMLLTRDGRRVFWLNPVFYGLPIRQSQIVQETLNLVRVRYAAGPEFTTAHATELTERLRVRLGDVDVRLERLDEIPRSANGKLRAVVCELPAEQRAAVLAGSSVPVSTYREALS